MRPFMQVHIPPRTMACSSLAIFLLATLASAHAIPDHALVESDGLELNPSIRKTFPTDILGEWRLAHVEDTAECPRTIRYLGFTRNNRGPFRISHSNIIQDGITCENSDDEDRDRRFRFYTNNAIDQKIDNENSSYRVPDMLLEILQRPGPARRTRSAASKSGEMYFVGFEAVHRVCNGTTLFRRGTTAFLLRPFVDNVVIRKIPVVLDTSKKWLVMVPYKSKACLYESDLNKFAQSAPSPSAEPEVEDPEDGEGGAPKPGEAEVGLEGSVSDGGHCFPSSATVRLSDGSAVPMSSLSIGDKVLVGPNQFSEVFMFTHKIGNIRSSFVSIRTFSGEDLTLTSGHYLYSNNKLVMAGEVRVGDLLSMGNGETMIVASIRNVFRSGLYNPQTLHGDIVVDGFRTSTYTEAIRPSVAHGLLSPLRSLYHFFARDLSFGVLHSGSSLALPDVCWDLLST